MTFRGCELDASLSGVFHLSVSSPRQGQKEQRRKEDGKGFRKKFLPAKSFSETPCSLTRRCYKAALRAERPEDGWQNMGQGTSPPGRRIDAGESTLRAKEQRRFY